MHRTLLLVVAVASPLAVVACSSDDAEPELAVEDVTRPPSNDDDERDHHEPTSTGAPLEASAPEAAPADDSLPPVPACALDTRTVYVEAGRKIESITAYGRYWSRSLDAVGNATEAADFPRTVIDEPKFASGPCAGTTSTCTLDTRVVYFEGGTKLESTTANGSVHLWSFANGAHVIAPGYPRSLTSAYAYPMGPCEGAGTSCRFDARSIEIRGGAALETITAHGQWYEALVAADGTRKRYDDGPRYLDDIARLATGPCKGQTPHACVLDTRTVYRDLDGSRIEEITAQGRLWVFRLSETDEVRATIAAGTALASIPRFSTICLSATR
jgi:hypothetical protein